MSQYTHKAKTKMAERQRQWLAAYAKFHSIERACEETDTPLGSFERWRSKDRAFAQVYREAAKTKTAYLKRVRVDGKNQYGLLFDSTRELPDKGTFAEWRRRYMGRGVEPHQAELVEAFEDRSNLIIFCMLPPGAGKDTTAGDFVLYEDCDNRELRAAWIMRGEKFAARRVKQRFSPYLTEPKRYLSAPDGPTSTVPEANLIEDYGPFKYRKGMVDESGEKIDPTTWTGNEIYFINVAGAPESDPNLWATGVDGQLYGARVGLMVMSDIFDRENQGSPPAQQGQYEWVLGTVKSRLDAKGRLVFLGTRCLPGDNYERLMNKMVGEAPAVYQGENYTKYANGVAVIIVKAITHNADGDEESYWPDVFPLDGHFDTPAGRVPDPGDHEGEALYRTLVTAHGTNNVERVRGLRQIRDDDGDLFETMYQQSPPAELTGDFTDTILDAADDEERTFGVYRPHELMVVGVDPARTGGAAWVCWGVDRDAQTVTLIDYFFGSKLGIRGIKQQLVIAPITAYEPVWYAYETNREAAVIEDPEIQRVFKDFGVNVWPHNTNWTNRSSNRRSVKIGVPSLSFYMRSRVIRWPMMTAKDRDRVKLVKAHFKTWDRKEALLGSRAPMKGYPDDLAMAAWVGFIKALELLQRNPAADGGKKSMPVPDAILRRWDRFQQAQREKSYVKDKDALRHPAPSMTDLVSIVLGDTNQDEGG